MSSEETYSDIWEPLPALEVMVTQLRQLLIRGDAQDTVKKDRTLFVNVLEEVEAWIASKGTQMIYDAQITLLHSGSGPADATTYIDWGKEVRKSIIYEFVYIFSQPAEIALVMYLQLMREASESSLVTVEVEETLLEAMQDAEDWLRSLDSNVPDSILSDYLAILQVIGDYSVAYYSVVQAMGCVSQRDRSGSLLRNLTPRVRQASEMLEKDCVGPDLNKAVQALTECLSFLEEGTDQSAVLPLLSIALEDRFKQSGRRQDLDIAIKRLENAINAPHGDDSGYAMLLKSSATVHKSRYDRFGDSKDISVSVMRFQTALNLTPVDDERYLERVSGLVTSLISRFRRLGDQNDIDKAIELLREAMKLCPVGSKEHAQGLAQLGPALLAKFYQLGDSAILRRATCALQEAHTLLPDNPSVLSNLGLALRYYFDQHGDLEDLELAIQYFKRAIELEPLSVLHLDHLANALACRFERLGRIEDIDSAIQIGQNGLLLCPSDHPEHPALLSNLGASHINRFERLKQANDLHVALAYHQKALDLTPLESSDRVVKMVNLGCSITQKCLHYPENTTDIDQAIQLLLQAASLLPSDHPIRPDCLHNLAISLQQRYRLSSNPKDLDAGIKVQLETVRLKPDARPMAILSNLLLLKYSRFGEVQDLNQAIQNAQKVVELTPINYYGRTNFLFILGNALMRRHQDHTHDPMDYTNAINAWKSGSECLYSHPGARLDAASAWASTTHESNNLELAAQGYQQAMYLLPTVVWIGLGAASQLSGVLQSDIIQRLACDAAACMISLAEADADKRQHYLEQAVELLDHGRSLLWSQTSQLRPDLNSLQEADPNLATELEQVSQALAMQYLVDQSTEATSQAYRRSVEKWETLIRKVRQMSGFESFLLPPSITQLRKAASNGPVIIVSINKYRCDALMMPCTGDVELIPLSQDAQELAKVLVKRTSTSSLAKERNDRAGRIALHHLNPLQTILHDAWRIIGEPVTRQLRRQGYIKSDQSALCRVWWCLTGSLTFLPIHASHPKRSDSNGQLLGMMDLVVSSYTPTISALLRSQQEQTENLSKFQMLAIGQSDDLPMVKQELECINRLVPNDYLTVLEGSHASVDSVCHKLLDCTWVHFACHGIQNHSKPMDSGLRMHDNLLTLSKVSQLAIKRGEFAFLSSCESAAGSYRYTDESMHIAACMQFVGFRSVIGTLWVVDDRIAQMIAEHVYAEIFKDGTAKPSGSDAALKLNSAIRYLRDKTKAPLSHWVPFVHFGV